MAFLSARKMAISCLQTDNFRAEDRPSDPDKNLLATGQVSVDEVIRILMQCRGEGYSESPHHASSIHVSVHVFRTVFQTRAWYIKLYFLEPDCIFISVHQS